MTVPVSPGPLGICVIDLVVLAVPVRVVVTYGSSSGVTSMMMVPVCPGPKESG